jgi:uncharacterized membrane protein
MTWGTRSTIGNRIAPARFLGFLVIFALAGFGLFAIGARNGEALMGGFDAAALLFLLSLWPLMAHSDAHQIARHAAANDANRPMLLMLGSLIALILLVTVGMELQDRSAAKMWLVLLTLALTWLFGNSLYGLHYAHLFYRKTKAGGLTFPGTSHPDYWDFLYFSFTLGMTFQTSDVSIEDAAMRRVVLAQSLVAFVFNIGILAFTISTLSS